MGILTQRLMDGLLFVLLLAPIGGGLLVSLAGRTNKLSDKFLRSSAFIISLLCVGMMGLVMYRRFYMPLGAQQLEIRWVDWFTAGALTVPFGLRMDTLSGVACLIVVSFAAVVQFVKLLHDTDFRSRGSFSTMTGAILLFILSDNLVLVTAALMVSGPFLAIEGFRRGAAAPERDHALQHLVIHGLGDAFTLYGVFFVFAGLGTVSYAQIATQIAGLPGINVQAAAGVFLFLLGVALRSGPGRLEAILPPIGALFIAHRLEPAVLMIPTWIRYGGAAVIVLLAVANLAHAMGNTAALFALSRQFKRLSAEFFDAFLNGFFLRILISGPPRLVQIIGERLFRGCRSLKSGLVVATIFLLLGALIYWRVTP